MTTLEWTVEQTPKGNWICRNGRGRIYAFRKTEEEAQALVDAHHEAYRKSRDADHSTDRMENAL